MKKSKPNILTSKRSFASGIDTYFSKRTNALKRHINDAEQYYGVEAIHDLRVEIKRIRALYNLIHAVAPSFNAEQHIEKSRKLFKKAGMLRDVDIQQNIIREGHKTYDLSEYLNYLKKQELVLRPEFSTACHSFRTQSLKSSHDAVMKTIAKLSHEQLQTKIEKYADTVLKKIKALLLRKTKRSQSLHDIRKLTKVARYTLDVWKLGMGSSLPVEKTLKELKSAANALGEWRDIGIARESLASYLEHDAPTTLFSRQDYTKYLRMLGFREETLLAKYRKSTPSLSAAINAFEKNKKRVTNYKRRG